MDRVDAERVARLILVESSRELDVLAVTEALLDAYDAGREDAEEDFDMAAAESAAEHASEQDAP